MEVILYMLAIVGGVFSLFMIIAGLIESSAVIVTSFKTFKSRIKHFGDVEDAHIKAVADLKAKRLEKRRKANDEIENKKLDNKIDKKKQILLEKEEKKKVEPSNEFVITSEELGVPKEEPKKEEPKENTKPLKETKKDIKEEK